MRPWRALRDSVSETLRRPTSPRSRASSRSNSPRPMRDGARGGTAEGANGSGVRRGLWILFGAVSLVLLIACANVTCLMLAQGIAARGDRRALLAGRAAVPVIRKLLLEAFCLALPGAAGDWRCRLAGASLFRSAASHLPRTQEMSADWRNRAVYVVPWASSPRFCLPAAGAARIAAGSRESACPRFPDPNAGSGHGALRTLAGAQVALTIVLW